MPLYAAYASNLDPARMAELCPHSPLEGVGWVEGWRLTFGGEEHGWDGAQATLVEAPDSQIFVAIYDVPPEDEAVLATWEGVDIGLYRKLHLRVQTLEGSLVAWIYVLDAYEGGLPSANYLSILSEAALSAGAPDDYVQDLRDRPCRSLG